jgi:hypothetical protein
MNTVKSNRAGVGTIFLCCLCSSILLISNTTIAQIRIAPPTLLLDDRKPTDRYIIHNSSFNLVEVEVELMYGYQHTDENGNTFFKRYNEIPDDEPSALEWVRIYPRHFILRPGEEQIVRMAARPPAGLPAGEYWVRPVIITQEPINLSDGGVSVNMTAKVNMRRRDVLSLAYRRGQVRTEINIETLRAWKEDGEIFLMAELERGGNAAYIGEAKVRVINTAGEEIASYSRRVQVFKSQNRTFRLPLEKLSEGEYMVELELATDALTGRNTLHTATVIKTTTLSNF